MNVSAEAVQSKAKLLQCTQDEYFADPCAVPSLSQSIAHTLVTRSPAHAHNDHPRLGNRRKESTATQNEGSLIHRLLLGDGPQIEVIEADNFRTKVAQELRDEATAAGKLPVLARVYEDAEHTANVLRARCAEFGLKFDGDSEVMIEWTEPGNVGDVICRGMLDHVHFDTGQIIDVKKIRSADARTISRHCYEYGYDIQHAAYTSALEKLKPQLLGRVDFIFVFLELDPPYAIVPARPDGMMTELGDMRWHRAVSLWEHCLLHNYWPGYTNTITTLQAPSWALSQEAINE